MNLREFEIPVGSCPGSATPVDWDWRRSWKPHYSVSSGREMRYCAAAERDKISTNDIVQKNGIKFMLWINSLSLELFTYSQNMNPRDSFALCLVGDSLDGVFQLRVCNSVALFAFELGCLFISEKKSRCWNFRPGYWLEREMLGRVLTTTMCWNPSCTLSSTPPNIATLVTVPFPNILACAHFLYSFTLRWVKIQSRW